MSLTLHEFTVDDDLATPEAAGQVVLGRPLRARLRVSDEAATAGDLRVVALVEAFEGDDPATGRRLPRSGPIPVGVPEDGVVLLPTHVPEGTTRVCFRASVERPAGDDGAAGSGATERAELRFPTSGALEVVPRGDARLEGLFVAPPTIYEELRLRAPAPSSGATPEERAVDHVVQQLRDLPSFFAAVFDRAPYVALPGEIGEDGQAMTGAIAPWQRTVIEHLSGNFYQDSPRRCLQNLRAGVGFPLIARCNNLVDLVQWIRGIDPPQIDGDSGGMGVGFNCNGNSIGYLARAAGVDAITRQPPADAEVTAPFVHDFRQGSGVNAPFRRWSLKQARPGSVFVYGDPERSSALAHIQVVMRIRRTGRGDDVEFQVFDTGAIAAPGTHTGAVGRGNDFATPSQTLAVKGKAITEEVWRYSLNPGYTGDDGTQRHCIGHAFIPPRGGHTFPAMPLAAGTARVDGDGTRVIQGSADLEGDLRREARRAFAHLVLLQGHGEDAAVSYVSRPFRLSVPLTHLAGSVNQVPGADGLEARWLVKLMNTWAAVGGTHRGHTATAVVELFNDAQGIARQFRPEKETALARVDIRPRFSALWPLMRRFYDGEAVKPRAEWPTAEAWYHVDWDTRVAAAVEGPTPDRFPDAIPSA